MADKLSDWFGAFIADHQSRFPRPDWPGTDDRTFWATWHSHFLKGGLFHREVADEASERLAGDPPAFIDNHLPKLIEIAQQVYRERHQRGEITSDNTREAAERASRNCGCGGMGLGVVVDEQGRSFGAYCGEMCPARRWIEQQHRESSPAIHRRFLAAERVRRMAETVATF